MRRVVVEDFRVQRLLRAGGLRSYTIVRPDGAVDEEADSYLRTHEGSGSQKTYAYYLVDHLRWRARERLTTSMVGMTDLQRYMGAVGAVTALPWGEPWRLPPQRPYGQSALQTAAACLKGFYLHACSERRVNEDLRVSLGVRRLPTQADRGRGMLGHALTSIPTNPLAPTGTGRRRHPKMPPEDARQALLNEVRTARDAMVVTWLSDSSLRIGGLTGLHLMDLHLRENAACADHPSPHVHVCFRPGNANGAVAKIKPEWRVVDGVVCGGELYRASPAMISSYFAYMTTEYSAHAAGHGMLLIQLAGPARGEPWSADAARGMLRRAGKRARLPGRITPKAFRHRFTSAVLDAAPDDPRIAQAAGNWSSARMVDEVYGHPDLQSPEFTAALRTVWGEGE